MQFAWKADSDFWLKVHTHFDNKGQHKIEKDEKL